MPVKVVLPSGKVIENVDVAALLTNSSKLRGMRKGNAFTIMDSKDGGVITDDTWDKVYEWLLYHKDAISSFKKINGKYVNGSDHCKSVVLNEWEKTFVAMEASLIFKVAQAAAFLKIDPLTELAARGMAIALKGLSAAEIRETLGIVNDFSPEEEEAVRAENQRAEDVPELAARLGQVVVSKKK